ncbi:MAG: hypothetical protein PUD34_01055 [bacterium]|nr:hypothetical protein [bacterium]
MNYLEKLGFTQEEIIEFVQNIPENLKKVLTKEEALVSANINFLHELGINNYKEIFTTYYDMFLMDSSKFQEVFNKYDQEDLIDKLNKNMTIIEYL